MDRFDDDPKLRAGPRTGRGGGLNAMDRTGFSRNPATLIWNLARVPPLLGDALILCAEGLTGSPDPAAAMDLVVLLPHPDRAPPSAAVLKVLESLEPIRGVDVVASVEQALAMKGGARWFWPGSEPETIARHKLGSTLLIQARIRGGGRRPRLGMKQHYRQEAAAFLARHAQGRRPIVVHLKNNPLVIGESNADSAAWAEFFSRSSAALPAAFFLIGDDPIAPSIRDLPNVVVTRAFGADLTLDLALIAEAEGFMGMAAGPCTMAIFSDVPYAVFKNPAHHAAAMIGEIGDADRYGFALPGQYIYRRLETPEFLFECCRSLIDAEGGRNSA
jgi:hypothetical protein